MVIINLFADPNFYLNGKLFTEYSSHIFTYNAAVSVQHSEILYSQLQMLVYKGHEIGFIFSIGGIF